MSKQSLLPLLVPLLLLLSVCSVGRVSGKIFDRCELAKQLQHRFGLPSVQVATLVCIAQHSSDLNTAALGGTTGPGGGSHGLFQISDVYWCSPPGQGAGCGLSCSRLRDDDIADDVQCVRKIYTEHQRISGDGFSAWQAYGAYCRQDPASYVAGCGVGVSKTALSVAASYQHPQQVKLNHYQGSPQIAVAVSPVQRVQGKIYNRCELAQELYYQHKLPMPQIPTWVCIAQHESSFNTAAVGRLNADGSADHGLFQISDLFWCTHEQRAGKGCHATCNQFLDSSISDDVQCIRRIHQEHTQISGDGFNAWTVYKRNCLDQHYEQVAACFAKPQVIASHPNSIGASGSPAKSKVSYAYQFAQQKITPVANQYLKPAPAVLTYQRVGVSSYQGNPFLRPQPAVSQPHPNAIGFVGKGGQRMANPFFSHKQPPHTAHFQQQYQYLHSTRPLHSKQSTQNTPVTTSAYTSTSRRGTGTGKVFKRCELAQELYFSHKFPMQDIATWVCIAEHESSLRTSAVGRLNTDGSADHGLFQISDLYWCTHGGAEAEGGKGCHINCDRLLDSDISDDVKCIRTIHEEHTRISGDGFTAWTVYNRNCRQRTKADIAGCFEATELSKEQAPPAGGNEIVRKAHPQVAKGKIFKRCELAQELHYKHKLPMKEIPTWVCIAEHESSFNTAAVGRLNADGSADHGLFQISDLYWCTHGEGGGKACHIECDRLLDSDISDDVKCIRTIHEEHTRLSGDGFNAWTVYSGHCRHQSLAMLSDCFDGNEIAKPQKPGPYAERPQVKPQQVAENQPQQKIAASHGYAGNPFLQNLQAVKTTQGSSQQLALFSQPKEKPSPSSDSGSTPSRKPNYDHNPFLKAPGSPRPSSTSLQSSVHVRPNDNLPYAQNPFLSLLAKPIVPARVPVPSVKPSVSTKSPQHVTRPYISSDSFRHEVIKFTATSSATTTTTTTKRPITTTKTTKSPITTTTTTTTKRPITTTTKTTKSPITTTTKTTTKSTARATVRPTNFTPWAWQTPTKTSTKAKPKTRPPSTTRATTARYTISTKPTTRAATKPISGYVAVTKPTTRSPSTTRPATTRRTTPTTRPSTTARPITLSTTVTKPLVFTRATTKTTRPATTTRSVPSTRATASTRYTKRKETTTRPTTTTLPTLPMRSTTRNAAITKPTQRPTARSTTSYSATATPTNRPTTTRTLSSTTPRPYLFTSTTSPKSSTTADPFGHPFFQKFKAKFEKAPAPVLQTRKPTTTAPLRQSPSSTSTTTSSPYYAKYQENKAKASAKTNYSYNFGQNRTTTKRPDGATTKMASRVSQSAFDLYLNWNKN
ncbi:uncharacterized protein LOC117589188 isoform X1 [Drosophila guanche]|uniref:uncharacterized protein LOC117589188 isoform X1 n=1 Tax=Drosophila guanche TaxID=7266 RepID=UPI0014722D3C|nr:uncharacterized protein LOC117589188 isoform X1 [Drosophila guanche]